MKNFLELSQLLSKIRSNGDMTGIATKLGGFPEGNTGYNDAGDAFKHSYGTALLVEKFGDDNFVRAVMSLREDGKLKEQNMDFWNNNVGIQEYHRWKEAYNNEETTDTLEKWIYDAVSRGDTINNPDDTRQWDEKKSTLDHYLEISKYLADNSGLLSALGKLLDFFIKPAHGADINPLVNSNYLTAHKQ